MDRNTIIAIVLSVIVITVGMTIQTAFFPPEIPAVAEEGTVVETIDATLPGESGSSIEATGENPDSTPFTVTAGSYAITFDPKGASVSSIKLTEHLDGEEPVELIFKDADDENAFMLYVGGDKSQPIDAVFSHTESVNSNGLNIVSFTRDFVTSDGKPFTITKQFAIPDNGEYMIQLSVGIKTPDGSPIPLNVSSDMYTLSVGPQIGPSFRSISNNYDYRRVSVRYDGKGRSDARFNDGVFVSDSDETVDWMSLAGKYFAFILIPESDGIIASAEAIQTSNETGVPQENIIYLNFEAMIYAYFNKASDLRDMLFEFMEQSKGHTYIFLDEVQNIEGWANVASELLNLFDCDKTWKVGESVRLLMTYKEKYYCFNSEVLSFDSNGALELSLKLQDYEAERAFNRCTFSREGMWVPEKTQVDDRMLTGFLKLGSLAWYGYRSMIEFLPGKLQIVPKVLQWCATFIPRRA